MIDKKAWAALGLPLVFLMVPACSDDGTVEEYGESVDEAVEETGEALEDATEEVTDENP